VLNFAHTLNTATLRKAAKVPYPAAYAVESRTDEAANRFNCAQRAHANFIENQPTAVTALLLAGLRFPLAAAALGAGWSALRYLYMTGYSKGGNGKGRYRGIGSFACQLGLIGISAYNGVMMILEK
jgi:glutathione S-transferase